jgi:hypothetical protein
MKNPNDLIANRTRNLPACSALSQPTTPPRTPSRVTISVFLCGADTSQPFRSAMYTLIGFVAVLLIMLVVCLVLLKRHAKERDRELF